MIRSHTDINAGARDISYLDWNREKIKMRSFFISLSVLWVVWMSAATALAVYSREVVEFMVEHF